MIRNCDARILLCTSGTHGQRTLQAPQTMQWAIRRHEPAAATTTTTTRPSTSTSNTAGTRRSDNREYTLQHLQYGQFTQLH